MAILAVPFLILTGLSGPAVEWISMEVVVYLLRYVLLNAGNDSRVDAILARANLWFVPLVNPDGLEYSRLNDSTWRKNRHDNGDGTFGVDLNRNYGYMWGDGGFGTSTSDPQYRGLGPVHVRGRPRLQLAECGEHRSRRPEQRGTGATRIRDGPRPPELAV